MDCKRVNISILHTGLILVIMLLFCSDGFSAFYSPKDIPQLEKLLSINKGRPTRLNLCLQLADLYRKVDLKKAEEYLIMVDEYSLNQLDRLQSMQYFHIKAEILHSRFKADSSRIFHYLSLEEAKKTEDKKLIAIAYFHLCTFNYDKQLPDSLIHSLNLAKKYIDNSSDPQLKALTLHFEARIDYFHLNNLETASQKLENSITIIQKLGYHPLLFYSYRELVRLYIFTNNHKKAIITYNKGMNLAKKYNDISGEILQASNWFDLSIEQNISPYIIDRSIIKYLQAIDRVLDRRVELYYMLLLIKYYQFTNQWSNASVIFDRTFSIIENNINGNFDLIYNYFNIYFFEANCIFNGENIPQLFHKIINQSKIQNTKSVIIGLYSDWCFRNNMPDTALYYRKINYESRSSSKANLDIKAALDYAISLLAKGDQSNAIDIYETTISNISKMNANSIKNMGVFLAEAELLSNLGISKYRPKLELSVSKVLALGHQIKNPLVKSKNYETISIIYENMNQLDKAIEFLDSSLLYYDNTNIPSSIKKIEFRRAVLLQNFSHKHINKDLNSSQKINPLVRDKSDFIFYIIICLSTVVCGLIIYILKFKKSKLNDIQHLSNAGNIKNVLDEIQDKDIEDKCVEISNLQKNDTKSIGNSIAGDEYIEILNQSQKGIQNKGRDMSDIVWVLNPENSKIVYVNKKIINICSEINAEYGCIIHVAEDVNCPENFVEIMFVNNLVTFCRTFLNYICTIQNLKKLNFQVSYDNEYLVYHFNFEFKKELDQQQSADLSKYFDQLSKDKFMIFEFEKEYKVVDEDVNMFSLSFHHDNILKA